MGEGRIRWTVLATAFACLALAGSASAATSFTVTPSFPATVAVGDEDVAASLLITNGSTVPDLPTQVDSITLGPSCTVATPTCTPDSGVFALSSMSVLPSVCVPGSPFTIGAVGGGGFSTFTPTVTPTLPLGGTTCQIDFTFDVLESPTTDVDMPTAGNQTFQVAVVSGKGVVTMTPGSGNGSDVTTVNRDSPTLALQNPTNSTAGGAVSVEAVLAAGTNPTGSVDIKLFGPGDATCTGPQVGATKSVPITGNGTFASGNFPVAAAGTYRYTASYQGDANNAPATAGCGAASTVAKDTPSLILAANPQQQALGQAVNALAVLQLGTSATGTIDFKLYGPNDANCSGAPVTTSSKPVSGDGNYVADLFTPAATGTYGFTAGYSGDANNEAASTNCGAAGSTVVVSSSGGGGGGGTAPETTITKAPKKLKAKKKAKAKFEFSSPTAGATFECRIDNKPFASCTSPKTFKVGKGKHTFEVVAIAGGIRDATPAQAKFKVKKKKPKKK